jgi:hypothetical protein
VRISWLIQMALRAAHTTTRSPRYVLGPGADLPIARIVSILLIVLPIGAIWLAVNFAKAGPSPAAQEIASFDPKAVLANDQTPHFLPTPVAALAPETDGAAAPATTDQAAQPSTEQVKVANTGGVGAVLRAEPPRGKQVAALRDGTVLQVEEHQTLPDGSDWLHVKTPDGAEGWVFSGLVAPAN